MIRIISISLAATLLSGCATFSPNPMIDRTETMIAYPSETDATNEVAQALKGVRLQSDRYVKVARELDDSAAAGGALQFAGGVYGALVTAFNPAPTNLKAAILATGAGTAWRTGLKPGARADVLFKGAQALTCVHSRGGAYLGLGYDADDVRDLRGEIGAALALAAAKKREEIDAQAKTPTSTRGALLLRLDEQVAKLRELDAALEVEAGAIDDASFRIAEVRGLIDKAVDARLRENAPDYGAAVAAMKATPSAPATTPAAPDAQAASDAGGDLTLEAVVGHLEELVDRVRRQSPKRATLTHERVGACVQLTG